MIIDYKTNWLAPPGEPLSASHYGPGELALEMQRSHYVLQALLYSAALHRYLRWRLPGYDPDTDLAGIRYLFLRGMLGPSQPDLGVFAWHPPAALVAALSDLLAGGDVATERARAEPPEGATRSDLTSPCVPSSLRWPRSATREEVLVAADVHVATTLGALAGVEDPEILRCVALAVAAARQGHAFFELAPADADLMRSCSALVASEPDAVRPVRLAGARLYLDRYWREEQRLAASLLARSRMRADVGDLAALGEAIRGAFPDEEFREQRVAAAVALLRDLGVIAGGPGTGKTTTVARIVGLAQGLAGADAQPLIGLCAPTGKAAARMQEGRRPRRARVDDPPLARVAARRALPTRRQQPPAPRPRDRR